MSGSAMKKALKAKRRRRETYNLVLDDPSAAEAAVAAAQGALRLATMRQDPAKPETVTAYAEAKVAHEAAVAELMTHVCPITFEAIPPDEWEQIRAEHPPTDKQLAKHEVEVAKAKKAGERPNGEPEFDPTTLIPALFARCVVVEPGEEALTEDEWAHHLRPDGDWSKGEVALAFDTCLTAILEPRSVTIPKG